MLIIQDPKQEVTNEVIWKLPSTCKIEMEELKTNHKPKRPLIKNTLISKDTSISFEKTLFLFPH